MTTVMTPSRMTDGQIEKAVNQYRDMLRKHADEIGSSDAVQRILGQSEYLKEQVAVIRGRVELVNNVIVRRVRVDRSRSPREAIAATHRIQYLNDAVVATMPHGEGDEVVVHFFGVGRFLSDAALDEEYVKRGLKAADPYSMFAVDEDDPAFADDHPHGTHWKDVYGKWCFATSGRWGGLRNVSVDRVDGDWHDFWWFAGVPQDSSASAL